MADPDTFENPDFHETGEAAEAMYLLGLMSIDYSYCEHLFATMIWHYVGGVEVGRAVTARLKNQSRDDLLRTLAREHETDKALLDMIEFASKVMNRCRQNRNLFLHAHSVVNQDDGQLRWHKGDIATGTGHQTFIASIETMGENINAMRKLSWLLVQMTAYKYLLTDGREPPPLPEKFPLPDTLSLRPHEA